MTGNAAQPLPQQSDPTLPTKHSLLLDAFRRIEGHSPVYLVPRLISTLNLHKTLAAARQRVCDGHKAQMKLLGADVKDCGDGGGISVQGDTTINNHGFKSCGVVGLVIAALLLGGGAGAAAIHFCCNKPPIVNVEKAKVDNWRLGLRVSNTP